MKSHARAGSSTVARSRDNSRRSFSRILTSSFFPHATEMNLSALVAWEAMLRGVPVIAYRAGWLTRAPLATGGLILEPGEGFATCAIQQIDYWSRSPGRFGEACSAVAAVALREREQAISDVLVLGADLFGLRPRGVGELLRTGRRESARSE